MDLVMGLHWQEYTVLCIIDAYSEFLEDRARGMNSGPTPVTDAPVPKTSPPMPPIRQSMPPTIC
jgi:hypothetical protein